MPRRMVLFLLLLLPFARALAQNKYQPPGPVHLDRKGEKWAEKTLHRLSLEEKVGQVFMIWVRAQYLNIDSPESVQLRALMSKYHIGSFAMTVPYDPPFLYRTQPYEAAELLNQPAAGFQTAVADRRRLRARPHHAPPWGDRVPSRHGFRRCRQARITPKPSAEPPRRKLAPSACTGIFSPWPT